MDIESKPTERIRFGSYEVDLAAGELRKAGIKIRLQPQPFQVLRLLLERPDEVVSREELKQDLWPDDTYVEFDLSLNTVIKKLRRALNDNPQNPRFIETLPRNGYRFIFPVERIDSVEPKGIPIAAVFAEGSVLRIPSESGGAQSTTVLEIVSSSAEPGVRVHAEARPAIYGDAVVIPRKRRLLERAAAVVVGALLAGLVIAFWAETPSRDPVRRWSFPAQSLSSVAVSPDGKSILFVAQSGAESSLWIRAMDQESPRRVSDTEGATGGFWSPDSQSLAFAADGQLKRISLAGGDSLVLCPLPNSNTDFFAGGSWSPDGEIIFSSGARLHQVAAGGGTSKPLFSQDADLRGSYQWPYFLPASGQRRAIVYSVSANLLDRRMEVMDLESGERRDLGPGSAPVYSSEGYLIY